MAEDVANGAMRDAKKFARAAFRKQERLFARQQLALSRKRATKAAQLGAMSINIKVTGEHVEIFTSHSDGSVEPLDEIGQAVALEVLKAAMLRLERMPPIVRAEGLASFDR